MALAAYRNLLRSARIAFQDDARLLHAAQQHARDVFRSNASLPTDDPRVAFSVERAEEVAKILRENIVQGRHVGGDKYRLRIHEHTERGNNDTVRMPNGKTPNGKTTVIDGKTCTVR